MAIIHLRAQMIGVAQGPVARAAYRHRTAMFDQSSGRIWNYTGGSDLVHAEVLFPGPVPATLEKLLATGDTARTSEALWNMASAAERQFDGQVAREFVIALPIELSRTQNIRLVQHYAQEFLARGFVIDWVYHDKSGNPHIHLMHTLRPVSAGGFGNKAIPKCHADGTIKRKPDGTIDYKRFSGTQTDFQDLRLKWYDHANAALAKAGFDIRLDPRSFADRGIDLQPSRHLGPGLSALKARNASAAALAAFAESDVARQEAIAADPGLVIDIVASQRAVFSTADIAKELHRLTISEDAYATALPRVLADARLVAVVQQHFDPVLGKDISVKLFATQEQLALETSLQTHARTLAATYDKPINPARIADAVMAANDALGAGKSLNSKQIGGIIHVTGPERLALLVGLAGTGKSTSLKAANAIWTAEGRRVIGTSMSGIATRGLESSSGIPSRTVAKLTFALATGRERLKTGDIVVLDEAGMLGTKQLAFLVAEVAKAGAKLVAVGDPDQLQPIGAGAPFKAMIEEIGAHTLDLITRQRDPYMRQATGLFQAGRMAEGLSAYSRIGAVKISETTDQAIDRLVRNYIASYHSGGSQIALAHANAVVDRLNLNIRAALQHKSLLETGALFETAGGAMEFSSGDRVLFGKTQELQLPTGQIVQLDRGALGRVIEASRNSLNIKIDDGPTVRITTTVYNDIARGYAATFHKSQGVTVDRAFAFVTPSVDRHMGYVGFSRHRHSLEIYAAQSAFQTVSLAASLSVSASQKNAIPAEARYLERRGIDTDLTYIYRIQGRLQAQRDRMVVAWATLKTRMLELALRRVAPRLPDAVTVTSELARAGVLSQHARAVTPLLQLTIAHRVTPASIAATLVRKADTMPLKTLTAAVKTAAERLGITSAKAASSQYVTGPAAVRAPAPPPPAALLSTFELSGTDILIAFRRDKAANAIMDAAGYRFDQSRKAFSKEITPRKTAAGVETVSDARTRELKSAYMARLAVNAILATRAEAEQHASAVAKALRANIYDLGIATKDNRIAITDPGCEVARTALKDAGAKVIKTATGRYYSFEPPTTDTGVNRLHTLLKQAALAVPAAPNDTGKRLDSPVGMELLGASKILTIRTAPLPGVAEILSNIQAKRLPDGAYAVRMDIQDGNRVKEALERLHAYHNAILVPPHSPTSGIDLPQSKIDKLASFTLEQRHQPEVARLIAETAQMIERHFGSLHPIMATPSADPIAIARVAAVATMLVPLVQPVPRPTSAREHTHGHTR